MCFRYWFPFLMLLFQAFNHCNFASLQICFLTKLMMIAFVLSITDNSWAALLINWFAFSFPIMLLRLNIHCMRIWHWFWRKLIKFCRMSSNNFALTLLFAFSLCIKVMMLQSQIIILDSVQLHLFSVFSVLSLTLAFMNLEVKEFNVKDVKLQLNQDILNLNKDFADTFT